MKKKCIFSFIFFLIMFLTAFPASASEPSAYDTLAEAKSATHRAGPFLLKGEENVNFKETANNKITENKKNYTVSGYIVDARETLMQFANKVVEQTPSGIPGRGDRQPAVERLVRSSFLITPDKIYAKTSESAADWTQQDIIALLPRFIALGTLDQFFMLELLNGDRLPLYADYLSFGQDKTVNGTDCRTIKLDIDKKDFINLSRLLTDDVKSLLGDAAKGMNNWQLALAQTFARGIFASLDAELHFILYIDKETNRIIQIETEMDMANPSGSRSHGTVSRILSKSGISLYDFGKEVERVKP